MDKFEKEDKTALMEYIKIGTDDRIFAIAQLLRMGESVSDIREQTHIDTLAIGYPLAFDANAEERDTRGLTSIR